MVSKLIDVDSFYSNRTSQWASVPFLVPKLGPDKFRFIVDLCLVNPYKVKYQFLTPIIEQELAKVSGPRFYTNFDFSHLNLMLPPEKDS